MEGRRRSKVYPPPPAAFLWPHPSERPVERLSLQAAVPARRKRISPAGTGGHGSYSRAIAAGTIICISGVIAERRLGDKDLAAVYLRAFDELTSRLIDQGCTWHDVVEISSFHRNLQNQIHAMAAIAETYIPSSGHWTAVEVNGREWPATITEIRAIAIRATH